MTEPNLILSSLAHASALAAELLSDAICNSCTSCVSEISDLNRRATSELAEAEHAMIEERECARLFLAATALAGSVTKVFSASMLLPKHLPTLLALQEEAEGNAVLAQELLHLCQAGFDKNFSFYSFHLCANKARGAHALLLTNYCRAESGYPLFPLALAMEAHRDSLENAAVALGAYYCGH